MPAIPFQAVHSVIDASQATTGVESTLTLLTKHLDPAEVAAVRHAAGWAASTFAGGHPEFQTLDTPYHDLEHTLQVFDCLGRLLAGWQRCADPPVPDARATRLVLIAALLHDSGYLKRRGEPPGSGARHTPTHVERGTELAGEYLRSIGSSSNDIAFVQSLIRCTAPDSVPMDVPFESSLRRRLGCALGTADLLGQMAADDYPEKLPLLFAEFADAAAAHPEWRGARTYPDLPSLERQTPTFWNQHVRPRLDRELEGTWRYLSAPWPNGPNPYIERIERNIARLRSQHAAV